MELAKAMKDGEMVPENQWKAHVDSLCAKGRGSKGAVEKAIVSAVTKRIPKKRFGIMFSGGVDSSLIAYLCKKANADFICYAVGIENSTDLVQAKTAAEEMGLKLVLKEYSLDEAEVIIKKVVKLVGTDPVAVGVGCVVYACMELAKKDKIDTFFSGLGSEEIFAGYERHKVEDINQECWNGLKAMYQRDFLRDFAIAKSFDATVLTPFLDSDLIREAMLIPGAQKIKDDIKKYILREIAEELGLPKEIAWRKKMAAQYGSKFDRAILRLAHRMNMQYKKEYLCSLVKLGVLFSSGKDSTYAMYLLKNQGYDIKCLITVKSKNPESYMFHTPNIDMAKYQAESLKLPLMTHETEGEKELELKDLSEAIKKAKDKYGLDGIVTGALYSEYQASRIIKLCEHLGLKCISPLWHMDQETEVRDIIKAGFKIIFTAVAAEGLNKKWLGHVLAEKDVDALVILNKKTGMNIAGEGGEFESLVISGPMFTKTLEILDSEVIEENENTAKLNIKKVKLI